MAFPPINIYSRNCDPEGVLAKLLELIPDAVVTRHPDGSWKEVSGAWKRGWLKGKLAVKANHDPDYYTSDEWEKQRMGMAGYFSRFPGAKERADLFSYISGLCFAFNLMLDPDPIDQDPRLALAFELARFVDGVIFLPGRMLDSSGNVILDQGGADDPDAVVPAHESSQAEESTSVTEEELTPPDALRLARRLIVISALVERAFLEEPGVSDAEGVRQAKLEVLQETGALDEAEANELAGLQAPIGALPEKQKWAFPWLSEGGMVIAWALGLTELPAYDEQVDVHKLYEIADKLSGDGVDAEKRSPAEVAQMSFQMLAIHWRIRQFSLDQKPMDFVAFAPKAWCGPMDLGLARIIGNDLAIGSRPIGKSDESEWKIAGGIMEERRKAIHWVLGHDSVYSENDTAT